jgi:16S rRNA (guanine1207-N2)-methyltransferase
MPDADRVAAAMVEALVRVSPGPRPLFVDEETGALAAALAAMGSAPVAWLRREVGPGAGRPWPPEGGATAALIRLPKSKDALDFALHAAAASVSPGAPIIVFGANDEGIRSAGGRIAAVAEAVETVDARRHCRVLAGRRREAIPGLRATLADWRQETEILIADEPRRWIAYPGVFAKGALDPGTGLLIATLAERWPPRAAPRVLDYAAGTGVVAACVLAAHPDARVDMIEIDALALAAAGENVPAARAIPGAALAAAGAAIYDLILSNPPVHEGVHQSPQVLERLVRDAPARLSAGGELRIVVLRHLQAPAMLSEVFGAANVHTVAEDGRFSVLSAVKAKAASVRGRVCTLSCRA